MLKSEWLEATQAVEAARDGALKQPALAREANLFLGRCFEQLGLVDRRLDAFTRATPTDSTDRLWVPAMQGVAEAQSACGRVDEALKAYTLLKDRTGAAWVSIARLRMIQALRTPKEKKPDWAGVEEALGLAEKVLPNDPEVRLLRATVLNYSPPPGNPAEARKRLQTLKQERPKDSAVWIALAAQDERDGNPELAQHTLSEAEKAAGDSPALRLARARFWVDAKEPELPRKLEQLASADKFTKAQERRSSAGWRSPPGSRRTPSVSGCGTVSLNSSRMILGCTSSGSTSLFAQGNEPNSRQSWPRSAASMARQGHLPGLRRPYS